MASFFRTKSFSRKERPDISAPQSPLPGSGGGNSSPQVATPPGNVLVNAYKSAFGAKSAASAAPGGGPGSRRTQVEDAVSMHLLMETAMHDSSEYAVLPPEEVDGMKRQLESLNARVDNTHRTLAMQVKVRDAALSMGKLDGDGAENPEGQEAARRCEELGKDLWEAEKEQTRLQRRLLEHTAGVLQMTHKGYSKDMSVASLTTGSSITDFEDFEDFDVNSGMYKPFVGDFEDGIIDIGGFGGARGEGKGGGSSLSEEQKQIIENVEAKVERLNAEMRETMTKLDDRAGPPAQARSLADDPDNPIEVLLEQTNALEQSVAAIREVQSRQLHFVNRQIYEAITGDKGSGSASPAYAAPPQEDDAAAQLAYMSGGVGKLRHLTEHMGRTVAGTGQQGEEVEATRATLQELWQMLNDGESGASPRLSSSQASFSLAAFGSRVQAVHGRVGALEQQKEVLTRQIQQQRELNASSDEVKDGKIADMAERLRRLPALESQTEQLEGEVARLKTELTVSQAELEGALGTRAQRKAEAAADPALTARVATLEAELADTIADYEQMTKQTIEHEREREGLEQSLDAQRDRIDSLEAQLSEERIHNLGGGQGSRTPATPATEGGRAGGGTSAAVLRAEFKKMMKDTKDQHAKRLKEEQDERRRLEALVRGLKKEQLGARAAKAAAAAA